MNESWVMIEFGRVFYGQRSAQFIPDYSEQGGQYFKICNHGKGDVFYFIVPNPKTAENKYKFSADRDYNIYGIVTKDGIRIYDILYPDGVYKKEKLKEVAELFKLHDKTENTIFIESIEDLGRRFILRNEAINGKGFYYGTIYSGECMNSSEYTGGIMLQRASNCYKQGGGGAGCF